MLLGLLSALTASATPSVVHLQGEVSESGVGPVDGVHPVEVRLFTAAVGGAPVWAWSGDVRFAHGAFSVPLGESEPLPSAILDEAALFFDIAVSGGAALGPRFPVLALPEALRAGGAGVARAVSGGPVEASSVRVNGVERFGPGGAIAHPIPWGLLQGVPAGWALGDADTLAALECEPGNTAIFGDDGWGCGSEYPHPVDASLLVGTLPVGTLPVGTASGTVASGAHQHAWSAISGRVRAAQLPVGGGAGQVARGDHTHDFADTTGTLPVDRLTGSYPITSTTGDFPIDQAVGNLTWSRTSGSLPFDRLTGELPFDRTTGQLALSSTTGTVEIDALVGALPLTRTSGALSVTRLEGTVPFSTLPVGTTSTRVAAGDHLHTFSQITDRIPFAVLPTGTTADTLAVGLHAHTWADFTGQLPYSAFITGTSASNVARGDHTHAISTVGPIPIERLPVGRTSADVAPGQHEHDATEISSGRLDALRMPNGTPMALCFAGVGLAKSTGSGYECDATPMRPRFTTEARCSAAEVRVGPNPFTTGVGCAATCPTGTTSIGSRRRGVDGFRAYDPYGSPYYSVLVTEGVADCLVPVAFASAAYKTSCGWTNLSTTQDPSVALGQGTCVAPACATGHVDGGTTRLLTAVSGHVRGTNTGGSSNTIVMSGVVERTCFVRP